MTDSWRPRAAPQRISRWKLPSSTELVFFGAGELQTRSHPREAFLRLLPGISGYGAIPKKPGFNFNHAQKEDFEVYA
jgi:hypothetical protein